MLVEAIPGKESRFSFYKDPSLTNSTSTFHQNGVGKYDFRF